MRSYRKYNWPALLEEFEQSDLTQTRFCEEKNINPKYFSQQRSKAKSNSERPFSKIEVSPAPSQGLTLEVGRCKIHCPDNMPLQSLATLVHTLA